MQSAGSVGWDNVYQLEGSWAGYEGRWGVQVGTSRSEKISVTLYEPTEHDEHTIIVGMWQYGDYNNLGSYCEFR